MKNKNLLLMLALLIVLLSITNVEAVETDLKFLNDNIRFYHQYGENLTIYQKCRVTGAVCDINYSCGLSVLSPSQELILENQTMLGDGTTYKNFTLNSTQTRPNGIYEATVDCTNGTLSGSDTFFYQVTPDGSKPIDVGQSVIVVVGVIILLLISIFSGFLGVKARNTTVMLSFLSFSVLLIVFALGFMLNIIELSFGTFSGIINNYSTAYVLMIILICAGAIGLLVYLIVVTLNYYNNMRGLTDKFSVK